MGKTSRARRGLPTGGVSRSVSALEFGDQRVRDGPMTHRQWGEHVGSPRRHFLWKYKGRSSSSPGWSEPASGTRGSKGAFPHVCGPTESRTEPMRGPGDGGPSGVFRKSVFEGHRPYMFEVGRTGGYPRGWYTTICDVSTDLSKTLRSAARLEAVFDVSARYSPSSTGRCFENERGISGLKSVFEAMFVAQTAQNRRVSPADDLTKNGEMFYSLGCSNEEMSGRWMRRREGRDRDATRLDGRLS